MDIMTMFFLHPISSSHDVDWREAVKLCFAAESGLIDGGARLLCDDKWPNMVRYGSKKVIKAKQSVPIVAKYGSGGGVL